MAMGRRKKRVRQEGLWTPTAALPMSASHPFYQRLNQILDEKKFDEFVEAICEDFYAGEVGRPGLSPGIYFRMLMVGYFEGIDSERGIAWRASDSLSIRWFVRLESLPDHSTISRTRRWMDVETHQAVFRWFVKVLGDEGRPMGCQELIGAMAAKGYWTSPGGKTPAATLYSALLREIDTKGDGARFTKVGKGMFALRTQS